MDPYSAVNKDSSIADIYYAIKASTLATYEAASKNKNSDDDYGSVFRKDFLFPCFNKFLHDRLSHIIVGAGIINSDSDADDDNLDDYDKQKINMLILSNPKYGEKEIKKHIAEFALFVLSTRKKQNKSQQFELDCARKEAIKLIKLIFKNEKILPYLLGYKNDNGKFRDIHKYPLLNKNEQAYLSLQRYISNNPKSNIGSAFSSTGKTYKYIPSFNETKYLETLSKFSPNNFNKLNKNEIIALLTEVADLYARKNNVPTPKVCTAKFEGSSGLYNTSKTTYGCYYPAIDAIYINDDILNKYEEFRNNKNYPIRLLQTIIHESRHKVQYTKSTDCMLNKSKEKAYNIDEYLYYLTDEYEIDARNSAMAEIIYAYNNRAIDSDSRIINNFINEHNALNQEVTSSLTKEKLDELSRRYNLSPIDIMTAPNKPRAPLYDFSRLNSMPRSARTSTSREYFK